VEGDKLWNPSSIDNGVAVFPNSGGIILTMAYKELNMPLFYKQHKK